MGTNQGTSDPRTDRHPDKESPNVGSEKPQPAPGGLGTDTKNDPKNDPSAQPKQDRR